MAAEPAPQPALTAAPTSLRDAVEAHARALVDGEHARFASRMTPQALASLETMRRPRGFALLDVMQEGAVGTSAVRFTPANTIIRERWQFVDGAWRAVSAELEPPRPSWWRRIARRGRA